jgi:hypothetical protein
MLLEASPRVPAIQYKPIITEATFPIFYLVRNLFFQKFPPIFVLAEVVYYLESVYKLPLQLEPSFRRKPESRVPGENRDPVFEMVPDFRRDDFWMPPYQVRGKLLKSGMTEKAVYGQTLFRVCL